jgi:hypothetical protein
LHGLDSSVGFGRPRADLHDDYYERADQGSLRERVQLRAFAT